MIKRQNRKYISAAVVVMAAVACLGCSAVRECKEPELNLPERIADMEPTDSLTLADVDWWEFYGDANLRHIIECTLANNKKLLAAAARVEQLQHLYRVSKANRMPNLQFLAPFNNETNDYWQDKPLRDPELGLKLSIRWELDFWGNLRWAKRKAGAEYEATVEDERAMRMTLVAEAASAYYRLMALDNELEIVRRTLVTRREGLQLAKIRFEGGLTSEIVYQQAQVEYATTAALIPNLEYGIEVTENALALLMGEYPNREIMRSRGLDDRGMPEKFLVGVPSELLQRRPDVRSSELKLKAAMAAVGVAYADRFPRMTIDLTGGLENDDFKGLLRSPFSYVAETLTAPIFGFGRKKAKYKASVAAYDEARLNYEQKVLEVFKEVDDAVASYESARSAAILRGRQLDAASKYDDLTHRQYAAGSIRYLEALDAQRRYLEAQIGYNNAIRDEHLAFVQLYKVLGGGWKIPEPAE